MSARGFRNRIVGLIRFSYPASSGFARAPSDPAAHLAQLYDPARLSRRFHLFETLTLPSLRAQADGDFSLVLLVGDSLPDWARDRLEAGIADLPQARIVAQPVMQNYQATQRGFAAADLAGASHLTSFRLDDDDALDRGFIARLRRQAELLSHLHADQPVAISPHRGLFLELGTEGAQLTHVIEKLPPGSGPALLAPISSGLSIYRRNHRLLPQFFTAFSDAETPAFLRSVHRDNDSNPNATGQSGPLSAAEMDALIPRHFPFTAAALRALRTEPA